MRSIKIGLLVFVPCLAGCVVSPVGSDAIRPAQLGEPVFVVVPANQTAVQDDFATKVEQHLLAGGMRVTRRPIPKAVRIETGGTESQAGAVNRGTAASESGAALVRGEDRIVDSFVALTDTTANYRINTYSNSGTIELVDQSNQQVLAVFSTGGELARQPREPNRQISGILRAIGFPVTQLAPPEQPSTSSPRPLVAVAAQPAPIFTVLPTSDWSWDIGYALRIERLLVRLALNVVRPPAPHYREQSVALDKGAATIFPGDLMTKTASARKIESFWQLEDTPANIILEATSYGNSVRVIDKKSKEVLSVATIYSGSSAGGIFDVGGTDGIHVLRDALIAAGVPVAEPPKRPDPVKPKKIRSKK